MPGAIAARIFTISTHATTSQKSQSSGCGTWCEISSNGWKFLIAPNGFNVTDPFVPR